MPLGQNLHPSAGAKLSVLPLEQISAEQVINLPFRQIKPAQSPGTGSLPGQVLPL